MRAYLLAHLAIVVVTAYFSVTYFHPDEHFQILEFVGHKLGTTSAAQMPWEFGARMRSWMQPAAYYVLARGVQALGVRDPFTIARLLRLASGLLEWLAVAALVRTTRRWSADDAVRLAQLRATTLLGFLPFLAVRTSAESVSCSLVSLAFCVVVDALGASAAAPGSRPRLPARSAVVAGVLLGVAFEVRFPTAVILAGLLAWLLAFRRVGARSAAALAGGGALAVALGLVVDRWGYGAWCFPAYAYLRNNLAYHVASARFGADPVYGYLYLLPANVFAPVVLVLMAALALAWARHPKHPVTWATFPYAVVMSLLAHKEERFFFPIVLLSTSALTLGFSPAGRASSLPRPLAWVARGADALASRLWRWRRSPLAWLMVADNLAAMLLLAVYPFGWRPDLAFYDYAYHHVEPDARVWTRGGWSFPEHPFYRRGTWEPQVVADGRAVEEAVRAGAPSYFLAPEPYEPVDLAGAAVRPELVYSEFPGWGHRAVRRAIGPSLARAMEALASVPLVPRAHWLTLYRLESAGASGDAAAR